MDIIDVQKLVDAHVSHDAPLCRVNDATVQIGLVDKPHEWHKHEAEDKFFYVVEGGFRIDLADRTIELNARQGFTVPKGVMHRTRATIERTVMLTIGSAAA